MLNVRKFSLYVLFLSASLWGMQVAQANHLPTFVDLVKETSPAVVNISTTQKIQTGMPELPEGFEMPEFYNLQGRLRNDQLPCRQGCG
jgi:serine protease Do